MGLNFSKLYEDDSLCVHTQCKEKNTELTSYTYDWAAIRYWCENHWGIVCLLFRLISAECDICERNHPADFFEHELNMSTIKFQDKYWDLCDYHYGLYHDLMDK
jgi:hypothetical protein